MCIACGALFGHILKEVSVCFSSYVCSKNNFLHLDVQTRIQPFSVLSLHEGVWEFEKFTTATKKLRVKVSQSHVLVLCLPLFCCCCCQLFQAANSSSFQTAGGNVACITHGMFLG